MKKSRLSWLHGCVHKYTHACVRMHSDLYFLLCVFKLLLRFLIAPSTEAANRPFLCRFRSNAASEAGNLLQVPLGVLPLSCSR